MSTDLSTFPRRMVHLDFHTGPDIPDLGHDFDAAEFAQTFAEAAVDSVTVFAKDHHGHLFYDTDRPERHPGLPRDLDLLGQQIEALHAVGIRAPIYLSVQCDEWAANTHPEWIALDEDLRQVKKFGELGAFDAGWQILDMSSPYQDFLAEQVTEVLERYSPVDGIFLDMCWDQPSTSIWAKAGMVRAGLDPSNAEHRLEYARQVSRQYMRRFKSLVEPSLRPGNAVGTWFNSRPKTRLYDERDLVRHVEIESLPSGGWGYAYFPYVARFVRPLGLPTLSHTGRFHKSWGDNGALKTPAALLYECTQMLSQGITCGVGDLLPPSGRPSPAVYDLIGSVYRHIEACEPFVEKGVLQSEVALIMDPGLGDAPGPAGVGAVRALQQLRAQFDVIGPDTPLDGYRVVIVPEGTVIGEPLAESLSRHVALGRGLVVSGDAATTDDGEPALTELGIIAHGASPFSHVFLHSDNATDARPGYDTVMYERTDRMTAVAPARAMVRVVEPYFERTYDRFSGHEYTVASPEVSEYAFAVRNGSAITFAAPIFRAFAIHGNAAYRELIRMALDELLPDPLVRDNGPSHLEATVVRVDSGTVVHLVSFIPSRLADGLDIIDDPVPVVGLELEIRCPSAPTRVTLQPDGPDLPFDYTDGYVRTTVSFTRGHAMVVVDHAS
ncbi:alpha-L-fucosidase [Lacisediminihabitans sp. FW035]